MAGAVAAVQAEEAEGQAGGEEGEGEAGESAEPAAEERKWKVDEDGKRYYLKKMEKDRFTRLEDGWVRPWNLMPIKVDSEDEEYFYFRAYERQEVKPWRSSRGATEEDLARYVDVERPQVDELRFQSFDEGLPRQGQWRQGFELADMNGDGHLDLVHGPPRKQMTTPIIFLGDGAGNWRPWSEMKFPDMRFDYGDVAVADFDGDSRLDLALAMHLTGYAVLVQEKPGVFARWDSRVELSEEAEEIRRKKGPFTSREVVATDWNRDSRPDVMILSEGPSIRGLDEFTVKDGGIGVRLLINEGGGKWRALDSGKDDHSFGDALVVADLNQDGYTDIVTGSRSRGWRGIVKLGDGEGHWSSSVLEPLPLHVLVWSLASGDFDADGKVDLVVGYRDNLWGVQREVVDLLLNRSHDGELAWERHMVVADKGSHLHAGLAVGDIDGDGHSDLVVLNGRGETEVYLGNGDGRLRAELSPELLPDKSHRECIGYEAQLHDLDGDGRDELITGFAGEPGGEIQLARMLDPRCPAQGSLRVWKAAPGEASPQAGSQTPAPAR